MATPPARASIIPSGALLPSAFKTLLGEFYDYVYALLGADGSAAKAREAMNVALTNHLLNPDGAVYQQAVAATADDTYMDDCWYALTQTGTITPSQVSNPEDGYRNALRLTQSQAVAQRMGRGQIIEGREAVKLRGKTVTFGGRLKLSTSANVRMAILAWTGTEDSVTSDVVNDWTSATYTAGNFFNSTTLTVVATSSTAMTAATAGNVSVSGAIPATANNIIILYWTEATAAQNVTLDGWGLRLVDATVLVDHVKRNFQQELALCQRFYEKSYDVATAPGTVTAVGVEAIRRSAASEAATFFNASFCVPKRSVPTVTWYNPNTGTSGQIYNATGAANVTVTGTNASAATSSRKAGAPTHAANGSAADIVTGHWVAEARL